MSRPRIFVCHSSADKEFVRRLTQRLDRDGIEFWLDELEIKVGDSIHGKIEDGLRRSDFFAVVLSRSSIDSPWVKNELGSAASMEKHSNNGVFILPVLLEECDVPPLLLDRRYANFKEDFDSAYQELIESIFHHFVARHPEVDVSQIAPPVADADLLDYVVRDMDALYRIPPRQFELLVASILESMGYAVEFTAGAKDGGYDLVVQKETLPGAKPSRILVECKRYGGLVGLDQVRALAGMTLSERADRGMLVTSSSFTKSAIAAAKNLPVDLIDKGTLSEWLAALSKRREPKK